MATMSKVRRLTNPGKRKRKMSLLQRMFFGSKRQRSAIKTKKNPSRRKSKKEYNKRSIAQLSRWGGKRAAKRYMKRRRKRNISSIVTVTKRNPGKGTRKRTKKGTIKRVWLRKRNRRNSGKRVVVINKGVKRMATRRRRRVSRAPRRYKRRIRNVVYRGRVKRGMYKYSSNPGRRRKRYSRRRRSNPGRRRIGRRRNPGIMGVGGGTVTSVMGVVGGVAVTKLLCGFLPASLNSGILGYLATGVIAVMQGKLVGKFSKSSALGHNMMVGGLAYLAAKVLNDFLPSVGGYTGISGMGLIGGSSFYNPQVNQNGSMGSFVLPSAVSGMQMMAPANAGVGRLRRTGRLM